MSASTTPEPAVTDGDVVGGDAVDVVGGLTALERSILAFEGEWRRHAGAKEEAIRTELGLSTARYYQLLGRLIDSGDALAYDPMLVKRLRRLRDRRAAQRAEREQALSR